jgi:enediyne biosynthesis protein E4
MHSTKFFLFFLFLVVAQSLQAQKRFTDVTKQAGIVHRFQVYEGMFGGGACVFDFNKDGFEDVFITGGMSNDVLYKNNGDGTFTDIFSQSGLDYTTHFATQGAASADVNRDGWPDLFVTTITSRDSVKKIPRAENLLFLNNGNSTFTNVTKEFGLDQLVSFSEGVSFGDFNEDGFPDAYIGNYFQSYAGKLTYINDATIVDASQTSQGYLLMNEEGQRFTNVYSDYGLVHKGFGFGGVFTDFDNDNDLDLLINHDFGYKARPNVFLMNEYPDESFRDAAKELNMDLAINAMGTAIGDYDNNGLLDYYITNIRFNRFMVNQGKGKPFVDRSKELHMDYVSISWGTNFADFDHDRDVDLFVANGDLNPNTVPLADYYFENHDGVFTEKAPAVGLNDYGLGRGSVVFDIENDGDLDILVVNQAPVLSYPVISETRLYRNDSAKGNWVKIKLIGKQTDLFGFGSRVEVILGKTRMTREIDGGSGYLSQNSPIAHFGLGDATVIDSIVVKWLNGTRQVLLNQKVNTLILIEEPLVATTGHNSGWWIAIAGGLTVVVVAAAIRMKKKKIGES